MVRGMEAVVMCNSQRVAGRVYDALCLNARGPGALAAGINYPELVPDAAYAKLGLTRGQMDDPMGRYLAAFGGGEQAAALSSPAAGAAGAGSGRAAAGSAADGSPAGSSSARSSGGGAVPPKAPERSLATVLDPAEIRALQAGLRAARQRQWKVIGSGGGGLLGVTQLSPGNFEASIEVPSGAALTAAEGAAAAGTRSSSSAATAEAAGAAAVDSGAGPAPGPPAAQPAAAAAARTVVGVFPSEAEAARAREEAGYRAHRVAFAPDCNFPDEHAAYLLRVLPPLSRAPTAAASGSAAPANDGSSSNAAAGAAAGSRSGRVRFEPGSAAPASSAQPTGSSASNSSGGGSNGGAGAGASGGGGDSSRRRTARAQAADTATDDAGADDDDSAAVWADIDAPDGRMQRPGAGTRSRGRADGASGAESSNGASGQSSSAASASSAGGGPRGDSYAGSAGGAEEKRVFRGLTYKASDTLAGGLGCTQWGLPGRQVAVELLSISPCCQRVSLVAVLLARLQVQRKMWEPIVWVQKARVSAGLYPTQVEAARAFDRLLLKLRGRDAVRCTTAGMDADANSSGARFWRPLTQSSLRFASAPMRPLAVLPCAMHIVTGLP